MNLILPPLLTGRGLNQSSWLARDANASRLIRNGKVVVRVAEPLRHIEPWALCLRRERDEFLVAFVSGHHRPGHPGEFVGERDGGDLGGAPRQERGKPGPMLRAVDLGIADHRKRARRRPNNA